MNRVVIIATIALFITACSSKGDIISISKIQQMDSNIITDDIMSATMSCNDVIYAKKHILFFDDNKVIKVQFFMPDVTYFMTRGDIEKDSLMSTLLALDDFETAKLAKDGISINNEVIPTQKCTETSKLLFTYKNELYYLESY